MYKVIDIQCTKCTIVQYNYFFFLVGKCSQTYRRYHLCHQKIYLSLFANRAILLYVYALLFKTVLHKFSVWLWHRIPLLHFALQWSIPIRVVSNVTTFLKNEIYMWHCIRKSTQGTHKHNYGTNTRLKLKYGTYVWYK